MTVDNTTNKRTYAGTGTLAVYPYPFRIFQAADIVVQKVDAAGTITALTLTTDYTVSGVGVYTGGNVTLLAGNLPVGTTLILFRDPAAAQATLLTDDAVPAGADVMAALDLLTMQVQALQDQASRVPHVPLVESPTDAQFTLPSVANRANKALAFDASGFPIAGAIPASGIISSVMQAVTSAATLALARLAMGPWGDVVTTALVTALGGTTPRSIATHLGDILNVKDFGAVGDGTTDDTAAIQAAAAALPSGTITGTLLFPKGHYKITSAITITSKGCAIRGEGRTSSVIRPSTNGAYWCFDLDTAISGESFDIRDIGIRENGSMDSVGAIRVKNCFGPRLRNVSIDIGGGCIWIENCQDVNVSDIVATSQAGNTVLRLKAVAGCITNVNGHEATNTTYGSGGRAEVAPCLWLSGLTTSLFVSNSHFQGGASREHGAITSITSSAPQFVVTLPYTHTMLPGEWLFIDGCATTAYNGIWKIESVTGTTATVLSTLNPGAAASGVCGKLRCCAYIDSSDGAVNECNWSNVMFEGWFTAREIGSVSVYMDGNNAASSNGINNHSFAGCYYDYGQTAVHLQGKTITGTYTIRGINFTGGDAMFAVKGAYIQGSQKIKISALDFNCQYNRATASNQTNSVGLHNDSEGSGFIAPIGIRCTGCDFAVSMFADTTFDQSYGLWIGGTGWDQLYLTGCHIFGKTAASLLTSLASLAGKIVVMAGNTYGDGAAMTTADLVPSVASAATIAIPMTDTVSITGATTVDTINGGWPGRVCTFVIPTGLTISAAGNVVNGGGAIGANSIRIGTFDGTNWRIR